MLFPELEQAVQEQKGVSPGNRRFALLEFQGRSRKKKFLQVEPVGYGPPRIVRMHNCQRHDDGTRPGGHLVKEISQQRDFRWYRRYSIARIQVEQAEIDFDVAVGGLNSALS